MNKTYITAALAVLCTAVAMPNALSQKNWNVTGTGAWETAGNWNSVGVPVSGDTVNITNGGTATISTNVGSVIRINVGGSILSSLIVNSGGSVATTDSNRFRIGNAASSLASVLVNGGNLSSTGAIYVGLGNNSTASLTVANGGTAASSSNIFMSTDANEGVGSTINIGGATTAAAAGWISANSILGGQGTGAANTNVLRFNHTSSRYAFTKGSGSNDAVLINGATEVNVVSGVTVLTGTSNYTRGTTVSSGATLLANSVVVSGTVSSTGSGSVNILAGGTLGGVGDVYGTTTVAGTLKPGDYDYGRATPLHGILEFGNNVALQDGSFTEIAINGLTRGTGFDALNVTGDLTLDGTLTVNLFEDFSIAADQTLNFLIFQVGGDLFGSYDAFALPDEWDGMALNWDTSALSSTGALSVTAVPEPSVVCLIAGAAMFWLLVKRRRRQSL